MLDKSVKPSLVLAVAICLAILLPGSVLRAQLQTGTVTVTGTGPQYCPSGNGFYPGTGYSMTCYQGIVACNNPPEAVAPIWMNWSVENAGAPNGTIVMFSGGAGTSASAPPGDEATYVPGYLGQGYTVVQTSWASAWEEADDGTGLYGDNIRYAACRPASFLKYIYNNVFSQNGAGAGMCAQGASAGSAAIVYALAWLCETDAVDPLDNAAGQGQLFYQLLAQAGEIGPHYTIDAVTNCSGDEGVGSGNPQGIFSSFPSGTAAIQYDMGNPQSPAKCRHLAQ